MEFRIGDVADITHVLDLRERLVAAVESLPAGETLSWMVGMYTGSIVPVCSCCQQHWLALTINQLLGVGNGFHLNSLMQQKC